MARPRTPTAILDARGAFKKHPERKRDGEPEVRGPLGAAPTRLNGLQVDAWAEIASYAPLGVLTEADRLTMEMAARLLAESWTDWDGMTSSDRKHLDSILGRFGMNPSDRAKLSIEKPKANDPFSQFD